MSIILVFTIALWAVEIIKDTLFWGKVWQEVDYRFDRMKAHITLRSSRKLFFNKRNLWVLGILIIASLPYNLAQTAGAFAALVFYGFFAIRSAQKVQNKTLKKPKFTLRSVSIALITLIVYGAAAVLLLNFATSWMVSALLAGDLLVPLIAIFGIIFTHPFAHFYKNTLLKRAAKKRKKLEDVLVIGITGSYGKTNVKYLLSSILEEEFSVLKTEEGVNSSVGIAKTILKTLSEEYDVFIADIDAYRQGDVKEAGEILQPQLGIITGINNKRAVLFGNIENIQNTAYELIESLPEKGLAIFNGDNENVRALARKTTNPKRLYATDKLVDRVQQRAVVEEIRNGEQGIEIDVREKGGLRDTLKSPLFGTHCATNIMGAVTVSRELGVDYTKIKRALFKVVQPKHALEIKKGIKESTILDDTSSSNPDGVIAALDTIELIKGGHKICIINPLSDLGSSAEREHKRIASKIAMSCNYAIVTSRDFFSVMYQEAMDNGMPKDTMFSIPDPHKALRKAQELTDKEDVILLENDIPDIVLNGLVLHNNQQ